MADPVVSLTNGVPTSGTGAITTLGQTLLDGANLTHGAIADAVVAAGATGSFSAKLRAISRDIGSLVTGTVLAAGSAIVGAVTQSGTWTVQPGNTANTTAWKVDDTAAWDKGAGTSGSATQRMIVDSSQLGTLGQTTKAASVPVTIPTDQTWLTGQSNKVFAAAATTLTRPANTTAYTAGDSISNNATAGSVTALSATVSDVNDDPIFISEILVTSTDTGLAGKRVRAYLFNSDYTASSGVVGGDNAAFSNKIAGYLGSFSGRLEAGFSDGTVGRLVPSFQLSTDTTDTAGAPANGFVVTTPTSGAKTIFIAFQAIDAFTPSANSTTIIARLKGWQARVA